MDNYEVALRMKTIFGDKAALVITTVQPLVCPSQSMGYGLRTCGVKWFQAQAFSL